jgi:hypothetical protein
MRDDHAGEFEAESEGWDDEFAIVLMETAGLELDIMVRTSGW